MDGTAHTIPGLAMSCTPTKRASKRASKTRRDFELFAMVQHSDSITTVNDRQWFRFR